MKFQPTAMRYRWTTKKVYHIATDAGTLCKMENGSANPLKYKDGNHPPASTRLCSMCMHVAEHLKENGIGGLDDINARARLDANPPTQKELQSWVDNSDPPEHLVNQFPAHELILQPDGSYLSPPYYFDSARWETRR